MKKMRNGVAITITLVTGLLAGCGGSSPGSFGAKTAPEAPHSDPGAAPSPLALSQPSGGEGMAPSEESRSFDDDGDFGATPRPGLGTEWGETRFSSISESPFIRADARSPLVTGSMFYNDRSGAKVLARSGDVRRHEATMFQVGGGLVSYGLRDGSGEFLPTFVNGRQPLVVGEAGDRYTIVVKNHTDSRFEVIVSVDGLDVLDGKTASFKKRGYLVDGFATLEIDGFRQSLDTVAAFRFGAVEQSYAERKHGDSRNVGVIGLAVFHERGDNPSPWSEREIDRRRNASPFPGQFATPPN